MSVSVTASVQPEAGGEEFLVARAEGRESARHHVSHMHLTLVVQERTATAWVPFTTPNEGMGFTNYTGPLIHRTWTLSEEVGPIRALVAAGVQMRVYAGLEGICYRYRTGLPVFYPLTLTALTPGPHLVETANLNRSGIGGAG